MLELISRIFAIDFGGFFSLGCVGLVFKLKPIRKWRESLLPIYDSSYL